MTEKRSERRGESGLLPPIERQRWRSLRMRTPVTITRHPSPIRRTRTLPHSMLRFLQLLWDQFRENCARKVTHNGRTSSIVPKIPVHFRTIPYRTFCIFGLHRYSFGFYKKIFLNKQDTFSNQSSETIFFESVKKQTVYSEFNQKLLNKL